MAHGISFVVPAQSQARVSWRDLLALTRPRVTLVAAITGWPALRLGRAEPAAGALVLVMGGLALLAAGCSALNAWIERDRDALMARTRRRPLPARRLPPTAALLFGMGASLAGIAGIALGGNATAAAIGIVTWAFYLGPYTAWAKPRTAWSAVVGAVPGAAAPLIADAAANGYPGLGGWTLFAIVFLWQAPHVWAIELFRQGEYAAARLPTMAARAGTTLTRLLMLTWAVVLVPTALLPWLAGMLGPLYGLSALGAGVYFVATVAAAMRLRHPRGDRAAFLASLLYITVVFGAMIVESMLR